MEQNGGGEIDFAETWRFADIVFVVEGRQLHANKTILSLWSPVFDAMLQGHFREKEAEEIRLPGKSFSELLELMRVLHPPNADICGEPLPVCRMPPHFLYVRYLPTPRSPLPVSDPTPITATYNIFTDVLNFRCINLNVFQLPID